MAFGQWKCAELLGRPEGVTTVPARPLCQRPLASLDGGSDVPAHQAVGPLEAVFEALALPS